MKYLKKADALFAGFLKIFTVSCCIGIALILISRVIIRFTPLMVNLSWTDEIVAWLMAWMIFIAAALIMRERSHFCVDLLTAKLKGTAAGCILNMGITLLGIAFFAAFLYYSLKLTISATTFSLSPILKMSDRIPYASMPTSCIIILIYLVRDLATELISLCTGRYQEQACDTAAE